MIPTLEELARIRKRLTPAENRELDELLEQEHKAQCRKRLSLFIEDTVNFKLEAWQKLVCARLTEMSGQRGQRILIHAGPQMGKSIILSGRYPAWILGNQPDRRVRIACYNQDHAEEYSGVLQELMRSDVYRQVFTSNDCRIPDVCKKERWYTRKRHESNDGHPSFVALGIGSGFTGLGVDDLFIDDPYKNVEEAYSPATRKSVWQWWSMVVAPRINQQTNIVIMFHRWHLDDIAGHLIQQGGWEEMRFPAICDGGADDPSYPALRDIGESLSPERYPLWFLEEMKHGTSGAGGMGETAFNALMQGKPVPDGGNIFKPDWWRFWTYETIPESFDEIIQSWDTAMTEGAGDYTVGGVWGRKGSKVYLLDVVRGQWSTMTIVGQVKRLSERWPTAVAKLIEKKGNGEAVIGFSVEVGGIIPVNVPPGDGKEVRAKIVQPLVEAGDVWLPRPDLFDWVQPFIDELAVFPASTEDGRVDMTTQALQRFMQSVHGAKMEAAKTEDKGLDAFLEFRRERKEAQGHKRQRATGWS